MKKVVALTQSLHISTRMPLETELSLGEFFNLMEGHVKEEFFHKIISEIKYGKQYTFTVKVVDVDTDTYFGIIKEMFEFTMYELEDDEVIAKKEELEMRRFMRW